MPASSVQATKQFGAVKQKNARAQEEQSAICSTGHVRKGQKPECITMQNHHWSETFITGGAQHPEL